VRLAQLTGLSTTTITNLISELLEQGIVVEEGTEKSSRRRGAGRPRTALRLVPTARHAVAVHIGVGSVRVAVGDLHARLLSSLSLAHPLEKSPKEVLGETVVLVEKAISQSGVNPQSIVGIGVGASGLVDPHTGINVVAPNLGWRDVPIRDWFAQRLGLPVCVDNNVRAMALGEALFGAGQDVHVLAFVYARIGVGAGFVVGGQLYRGSGAGAGEIGHTTVIPEGGEPCRCGNTGCLETLVSEPAIIRLAKELAHQDRHGILATYLQNGEGTTIERIFAAARAGDMPTRTMLNERARYMGVALANLVNILNPELILLGGVFAQGQDLLLPVTEATIRQRAFANLGERVRLQTTSFGHQAGVVGAAALALNTFFYQPA
ncbi:MAG TPA: ROK family protein, partial [Anaerolineae bacterium]|nr:ROK family protein [Anaerolineae bacterium]HIQ05441.1 ROK family protein [Anaerolineae bacterium]